MGWEIHWDGSVTPLLAGAAALLLVSLVSLLVTWLRDPVADPRDVVLAGVRARLTRRVPSSAGRVLLTLGAFMPAIFLVCLGALVAALMLEGRAPGPHFFAGVALGLAVAVFQVWRLRKPVGPASHRDVLRVDGRP